MRFCNGFITTKLPNDIGGLVLNTQNFANVGWVNQAEISWENGNSVSLNNGVDFNFDYFIPKPNSIDFSCRTYELRVCFKVRVTDTKCNTCVKTVCKIIKVDTSVFTVAPKHNPRPLPRARQRQ